MLVSKVVNGFRELFLFDTKLFFKKKEAIMQYTIGEKIKIIRKDNKLTQTEFAKMFGLSHSHISNIENNRENPSETLILFVCSKFNISYNWLKNDIGDKTPTIGSSKNGAINTYNYAKKAYEDVFSLLNDEETANYTDAAFYVLQTISSTYPRDKFLRNPEILEKEKAFFSKLWLITTNTNKLVNAKKSVNSDDKLEYVLKFHKLLQKAINQFTELQKSLLLEAGIEIDL